MTKFEAIEQLTTFMIENGIVTTNANKTLGNSEDIIDFLTKTLGFNPPSYLKKTSHTKYDREQERFVETDQFLYVPTFGFESEENRNAKNN